jgi:putative acetyltransferase
VPVSYTPSRRARAGLLYECEHPHVAPIYLRLTNGVSLSWTIRTAEPKDRDSIIDVVRDAFTGDGRDGSEEVAIVHDTWSLVAEAEGHDLVAVEDQQIVGHILGATGSLSGRPVMGIAPLSVAHGHQGEGIGSALMTELLGRAEAAGEPLVVLLGFPDYYARFGFEPSAPLGISYPPVGPSNPHFMVRKLARYDSTYRGEYAYCWEGP